MSELKQIRLTPISMFFSAILPWNFLANNKMKHRVHYGRETVLICSVLLYGNDLLCQSYLIVTDSQDKDTVADFIHKFCRHILVQPLGNDESFVIYSTDFKNRYIVKLVAMLSEKLKNAKFSGSMLPHRTEKGLLMG